MAIPYQRVPLFGVNYAVVDYEKATAQIISCALNGKGCGVSALAVHGLMEACNNPDFKAQVNTLDLVVPDGQPVRWAMNNLFKTTLTDRVYGPELTVRVLEQCHQKQLKLFLFGSKADTLQKLVAHIQQQYPGIEIVGVQADRFREATADEDAKDIALINGLYPHVVLVGRGCPRQEKWVAAHLATIPRPMMAVGAAFDFLAGTVSQAPAWMQGAGLEWLYRLCMEPGRLWKRYLFTNSQFLFLFGRAILFKKYR